MFRTTYLRLVSDLHLSPGQFFDPVPLDEDWQSILLVAGDLGDFSAALQWLTQMSERFARVVVVLGNHDYYSPAAGLTHGAWLRQWRSAIAQIDGCVLLEQEMIELEGVRIAGATLWTDFGDDDSKMLAATAMRDYQRIFVDDAPETPVSPAHTQAWHRQTLPRLAQFIQESRLPTVVLTHHAPTWQCVSNPDYRDNPLTHAYVTDLEGFMHQHQPLLWCYGHTHEAFNRRLGQTLVLSNPNGFYGEETGYVYDQQIVIDGNECRVR